MQRNGLESGVPENFKGVKGRSGRRKLSEEIIKKASEYNAKEIAKNLVNRHLQAMQEDKESDTEELVKVAMPIYLKDKPIGDKDNPLVVKEEIDETAIERLLNAYELHKSRKNSNSETHF